MSTTQAATSQHTNGLGGPLAAQAQQAVTNIPGALTTTIGTVGNCWRQVRVPSPHDEFFYDVVVIFDPKDGEFLAKLDFRRQEEEELIVYRSSLKALIEELPVLIKQRLSLTDEIKIRVNISEIIIHA